MLSALAFVPEDEVIDTFEELIAYDKNHPTEKNLIPTKMFETIDISHLRFYQENIQTRW